MEKRVIKVEFGVSSDGTTAPASYTQIPEILPFDWPEDDVATAELADRTEVTVDVRTDVTVQTYAITDASLGTLRTHASNLAQNKIWLKLTKLDGGVREVRNVRVRSVRNAGGNPPRVEIVFQKTTVDGAAIV